MAELSKNATKIMDLVKELTIVELNDLVTAMEEEFGVSAAAPVMMAGAAGWEDEGPSTVNVVLTAAGGQKIAVIKVVKEITGLGLKEAKDIVDNGGNVKEGVSQGEEVKAKLEEAGASVELK